MATCYLLLDVIVSDNFAVVDSLGLVSITIIEKQLFLHFHFDVQEDPER